LQRRITFGDIASPGGAGIAGFSDRALPIVFYGYTHLVQSRRARGGSTGGKLAIEFAKHILTRGDKAGEIAA
jgi:hypothetical protein